MSEGKEAEGASAVVCVASVDEDVGASLVLGASPEAAVALEPSLVAEVGDSEVPFVA